MARLELRNTTNRTMKIPLTKLLRHEGGLDLASAKMVTDDLLKGEIIYLEIESAEMASELLGKIKSLNVNIEITED